MFAPRAFACSYSSSTTAPAPSPSTKPSRSLSQGRLAVAGSPLRVESARVEAKPPTAYARAEVDADALGVLLSGGEAAVPPRLQSSRHAVVDEEVHAPRFLRRHVRREVEVLHLARDLARKARRIEARDARDARFS